MYFKPPRGGGNGPPPGSFDLLGFTHYWGQSRKGSWVIKRKTAKGRFKRALKGIAEWCRRARHGPVQEQHKVLSQKLRGHYAYYGITGNSKALDRFRLWVKRTWHKWLARRSQRGMNWERFTQTIDRVFPLPPAIAVHSKLRRA